MFAFEVREFGWALVRLGESTFRASYVSDCLSEFADALLTVCGSAGARAANVWYAEPSDTRCAYSRRGDDVEIVISRRLDEESSWSPIESFCVDAKGLASEAVTGLEAVDRHLYLDRWPMYGFPSDQLQSLRDWLAATEP